MTNDCPDREKAPNDGELLSIKVRGKSGAKASTWNWCSKCAKWQGHSTTEHKEQEQDAIGSAQEMTAVIANVVEEQE